jgi:hypothetical protein
VNDHLEITSTEMLDQLVRSLNAPLEVFRRRE